MYWVYYLVWANELNEALREMTEPYSPRTDDNRFVEQKLERVGMIRWLTCTRFFILVQFCTDIFIFWIKSLEPNFYNIIIILAKYLRICVQWCGGVCVWKLAHIRQRFKSRLKLVMSTIIFVVNLVFCILTTKKTLRSMHHLLTCNFDMLRIRN